MNAPYLESCPIGCNAPLHATEILLPEGALLCCAECGQLISQCSEERYLQSMQEFDDAEGTLPKPDARQRRFIRSKRYLDRIEGLLGSPRKEIRLLDVGCSAGYFIDVAGQLGFYAEGVEPAERAVTAARARGLAVHHGVLEALALPERSFYVITMFEVVEHLRDALSAIQRCNHLLRPGGILVIGTASTASWTFQAMKARWEYLHIERHGGHVSFFNPRSMNILAQRSGFIVEEMETRSVSFADRNTSHPASYRMLKIASELMETPSRWFGKGHDMLAVLRKAGDLL